MIMIKASIPPLIFLSGSVIFLLLIVCGIADGLQNTELRFPYLISDGVHDGFLASDSSCDQTYGFLPCTTTVLGNLFLIIAYGYLMSIAATYLASGSELLTEILGPGHVGGFFLPMLGALPDAMLILVSGLSGSTETAQNQVSVGMGLLAGSTVLLLTVIWGTCVVVGKCDLDDSIAKDEEDTKGFSLTRSGVTTDIWTSYVARIMAVSVIPYLVVQLPQVMHSTSGRRLAVLIALIVSLSLLISYCLYEVFHPWIQKTRINYAMHKLIMSGILRHLKMRALGRLLKDDGTPNEDVLMKLFKTIDLNSDEMISVSELRALTVGIKFNIDVNDEAEIVMREFDTSLDCKIDYSEFFDGICKWLEVAKRSASSPKAGRDCGPAPSKMDYLDNFHSKTTREHYLLAGKSTAVDKDKNPKWSYFKAVLMLLLGTFIGAAFADPLVDAVDNFSDATNIPSFFVSFVALPLATNYREAVPVIITARQKTTTFASLTFSELYGKVTTNNVLSLPVFLALVYSRGLTWDFSSEVLIILIVCIVMGALASLRTTFPLWTSLLAFLLYPFSLALLYVLQYIVGWS